jgi:hypothetical protein
MAIPWPNAPPTDAHRAAFADATARPYWLDALPARDPQPQLDGPDEASLSIVGGCTGLWAALHAKGDDPVTSSSSRRTRDRLLLSSREIRREVVRASRMYGTRGRLILLKPPRR